MDFKTPVKTRPSECPNAPRFDRRIQARFTVSVPFQLNAPQVSTAQKRVNAIIQAHPTLLSLQQLDEEALRVMYSRVMNLKTWFGCNVNSEFWKHLDDLHSNLDQVTVLF